MLSAYILWFLELDEVRFLVRFSFVDRMKEKIAARSERGAFLCDDATATAFKCEFGD